LDQPERREEGGEEFTSLLRYTLAGYVAGLVLGVGLDRLGLQRSGLGQWAVRTVAGEGESLFEGFFAFRQRLKGGPASMAEAYGWGKLLGMAFPWMVDAASRAVGLDVYAPAAFYIPYFYAMSDQIGANISGFVFLRRASASWGTALRRYAAHPVMLASLAVILAVPIGLGVVRLAGFSPTTQLRTALETVAANLCWVPPLVGWLRARRAAVTT
jgi:hypothetical protein